MLKWTCSKSPISPQVSAGTTIEFAPEDRHRPETMTKSPPLSPSQKEYDHPYAIEVDSPARPADNETMTKSPTLSPTYKEDDHPYAIEVDPPVTPTGYHHGSPRARDNGVGNIKIGGWETTLCCGCFKHCVPNCCMVTFCPCVTHAQITARLGMASYWCALATLFTLVLLTGGTVHVILFIWIWKARALTRERFQIPGGCCRDCCASLFCPCCTLAQIATHIKSYQPGSCDFGPPDTLPPYSRT
ncbi:hypothetical protein L917_03332 [Phytophthora nicotianae]|uniref:PLAC8 family protein n=2 Tax=Phytophthora nicotianae TaxID=4792 RepID=V9FR15_PHYNI|nr:hypothetical protein F443_03568 [Phytophthora nicotianae P1569]ETL99904.1 hypothetical protein L917_03332 [Phytophthora nicotianae]